MGSKSMDADEIPFVGFHELAEYTDNFCKEIGTGTRGIVYKGSYNGKEIAVKIPSRKQKEDPEKEFDWEFKCLLMLKHPNIIQLIAYCHEIEKKYNKSRREFENIAHPGLCYEYAANGSLGNYIYGQGHQLDWAMCYKIIVGICEGLNYLHNYESGSCIYHLDLKPDNILLTDSMVPKISGFGMFNMYTELKGKTSVLTLGTPKYSPPEYHDRGEVSKEFDIYSLGVTIIEILAGPQMSDKVNNCSRQDIVDHVRKIWRRRGEYCEQVNTCIDIALKCLNHNRRRRPEILDIIYELNNVDSTVSPCLKSTENKASGHEKISGESTIPSSSRNLHGRYPVTDMDMQWQKLTHEFQTSILTSGNKDSYSDDKDEETHSWDDDSDDNVEQVTDSDEEANDARSIQTIRMGFIPPILFVDVHPTKQWVVTSHRGGQVCLWDYSQVQGKSLELTVNVSDTAVWVAKFIDEKLFVAGDDDGTIYVHNYIVDRQIRKFRAHHGRMECIAIHPSRKYMLSAASDGVKGRLQLWDGNNHWERSQILPRNQETVRHIVFNPLNPDDFAIAYENGTIQFQSISANSKPVKLRVISNCLFFVDYITLDGRQFLISATEDGIAKIWEADSHTCFGEIEVKEGFRSASCYPENPVLIASTHDGYIHRWNVATGSQDQLSIGFEPQAVRSINKTRFVAGGEQEIGIVDIELL